MTDRLERFISWMREIFELDKDESPFDITAEEIGRLTALDYRLQQTCA